MNFDVLLPSEYCEMLKITFCHWCFLFLCLFCFCSDPYVKLSLYVADENKELALVQTKTIKKVSLKVESVFHASICSILLLLPLSCKDLLLAVSDLMNCNVFAPYQIDHSCPSNFLPHRHHAFTVKPLKFGFVHSTFQLQIWDHHILLIPPPPLSQIKASVSSWERETTRRHQKAGLPFFCSGATVWV